MARFKLTIILGSGARIGPGKAQLLESIRDTGSISSAAREMGMARTRAHDLIESINIAFEVPVVVAATGGQRGGGAMLTEFGHHLLDRYRRLEAQMQADYGDDLAAFEAQARPAAGPKV